MHRLTVALLAAFDAALAAAVGVAAVLAPLALIWIFGLGAGADWTALWPASVTVWQLGHLVPLHITLPGDYLAGAGIPGDAASFVVSLAPLALAGFTAIFAARSGRRAARADAWPVGVAAGTLVFALLATVAASTGGNDVAGVALWQAVLLPTLVFALPLFAGAVVAEWRDADDGGVARWRDRLEARRAWGPVPALVARGGALVLVGLVGLGALALAVGLAIRGAHIVALFETANVDALGATAITLGQLAYLPTLVVWALSYVAGPGFALGAGTAVSPGATQVGVLPGIPVLGVVPPGSSPWLLLLALLPIALGAFAGWVVRSRLAWTLPVDFDADADAAPVERERDPVEALRRERSAALSALLVESPPADVSKAEASGDAVRPPSADPFAPRFGIAVGIAAVAGVGGVLLGALASGSVGPGRLAEVGPNPGVLGLAVGLEVFVGAAILLLAPRSASRGRASTARNVATGSEPATEKRSGVDRSRSGHSGTEERSGTEKRSGSEKRSGTEERFGSEKRSGTEKRFGSEKRSGAEERSGSVARPAAGVAPAAVGHRAAHSAAPARSEGRLWTWDRSADEAAHRPGPSAASVASVASEPEAVDAETAAARAAALARWMPADAEPNSDGRAASDDPDSSDTEPIPRMP